jgi:hypothetical protein
MSCPKSGIGYGVPDLVLIGCADKGLLVDCRQMWDGKLDYGVETFKTGF